MVTDSKVINVSIPINKCVNTLFEFIKDYLKNVKIEEFLVLIISKALKNWWFSQKNQKWNGGFLASYLTFFNFKKLRIGFIYHYWVFDFLKIIIMNPNNHVNNCQGLFLFPVSTQQMVYM